MTTALADYARQSRFTDPGEHRALLDDLPTDIRELAAVVNGLIVHYRAGGYTFTGERLAEIDHRWLDRLLPRLHAVDGGRTQVLGSDQPRSLKLTELGHGPGTGPLRCRW